MRTRRINEKLRAEAAEAFSESDTNMKEEGDPIEMDRLFEMAADKSDDPEKSDIPVVRDSFDEPDDFHNADSLVYSDESDDFHDTDIVYSDESDDFYDAAAEKQLQDSLTEAARIKIETPRVAYLESLEKWEGGD
ncbi:hypothetical protein N7540_010188 [Penicillium herquei]|nr:hypothetical protein N7540_010188 [Penicillium herquei]